MPEHNKCKKWLYCVGLIGYIVLFQNFQNITFLIDYFAPNLDKWQDIIITVLL